MVAQVKFIRRDIIKVHSKGQPLRGTPLTGEGRAICEDSGNHSGCIKIIDDPDPDGGFDRGALITQTEAAIMLRMSCFTMGSIVEHPRWGRLLVVPYERKYYRRLNGSRKSILIAQDQQALQGIGFWLVAPYATTGSLYMVRRLDVIGVV